MATILVVEDDVFVNMEAIFVVEELGHLTLHAYDVDQALAILQADEQIDLLFTDIRLKDRHLGGYELAIRAVELRPDICVLYATGSDPTDPSASLVLKGAHFLQKPYGDMQLRASLETALQAALGRQPTVSTDLSFCFKELPDDRQDGLASSCEIHP
jgi:CheY-like chemotaxis protein